MATLDSNCRNTIESHDLVTKSFINLLVSKEGLALPTRKKVEITVWPHYLILALMLIFNQTHFFF